MPFRNLCQYTVILLCKFILRSDLETVMNMYVMHVSLCYTVTT